MQPEIFQGRAGFLELEHFNKHFVNNTRKRDFAGKHFGVFSPRYSYYYTVNGEFNPEIDIIRAFFLKIRAPFSIFKKG